MLYRDRRAQVIYGNTLTEPFIIQTADAYSLRSYFSVRIDWVVMIATKHQRYLMDSLPTAQWPWLCGRHLPSSPPTHSHASHDLRPSIHSFTARTQTFSSISIASVSLVQRITNFVYYELLEKSLFQNLRKTALITYFVIISVSAAYFASLSLSTMHKKFGSLRHGKTRVFKIFARQLKRLVLYWLGCL